jgi:hypothetical protein
MCVKDDAAVNLCPEMKRVSLEPIDLEPFTNVFEYSASFYMEILQEQYVL